MHTRHAARREPPGAALARRRREPTSSASAFPLPLRPRAPPPGADLVRLRPPLISLPPRATAPTAIRREPLDELAATAIWAEPPGRLQPSSSTTGAWRRPHRPSFWRPRGGCCSGDGGSGLALYNYACLREARCGGPDVVAGVFFFNYTQMLYRVPGLHTRPIPCTRGTCRFRRVTVKRFMLPSTPG